MGLELSKLRPSLKYAPPGLAENEPWFGQAAGLAHRVGHEIDTDRTRHTFAPKNRGEKYAGPAFDDYYTERRVSPAAPDWALSTSRDSTSACVAQK